MHAILAHAYHLALYGLHVLGLPLWRPPAAALAVALTFRLLGVARSARGTALASLGAVLAGWLLLNPHWASLHPPPLARLPGLALILLAEAALRTATRPRLPWITGALCAALASWWLRGAPLAGPAIVNCMPVFLGLAAGLPVARRLARTDRGWGVAAASAALAGSLMVTGAATHWARAAIVPGMAGLALLGAAGAAPQAAASLVMVAGAAIVASDRGRLVPVDAACVAPFLLWLIAPRLSRAGPVLAWAVAAAACVGLSWIAMRTLG